MNKTITILEGSMRALDFQNKTEGNERVDRSEVVGGRMKSLLHVGNEISNTFQVKNGSVIKQFYTINKQTINITN